MSHIIPLKSNEKCIDFGCQETMKYICKKQDCKLHDCSNHGQAHGKHRNEKLKQTGTITVELTPTNSENDNAANVRSENTTSNCEISECQGLHLNLVIF